VAYLDPVVAQLQLSLTQFQSEAPKAVQILEALAGPMTEAGAKVGADAGTATGKALATTLEEQGKAAAQAVFEEEVSAAAKAAAAASEEVNVAAGKMGSALSGGAQFGTTAFNNMQMAAMQAGVSLGPIPSAVNVITQATQGLQNAWDSLPDAVAKVGAAITAVGGVVTVVGALLVKAGQGVEQNQAALANTIQNTGHSYDEYAGSINQVISAEAKHGESASEVMQVLNKLDLATQDMPTAIKELTTVENVAVDTHTSLAKAAQNVTLAEQGKGRLLAQLNIQTVSQTKVVKDLATAEKDHAAAVDALQKVQQTQADQAQISAAKEGQAQIQAASAAKAHRDALANLNTAEKEFATLAAGPAAKDVEAGYIAIANAAKTTRDAAQKVIDTQKALNDLAKGPDATDVATAQENIGKAQIGQQRAANTLADATANLSTLQASGTATSRQLADAQLAIQEAQYGVTDANKTYSDSQAALNKLQTDSLPGSAAMTSARNQLADAQLALRQANLSQADAQQKQNDLFAASLPGSTQYAAALKKVQDAQDQVAQSEQGVVTANVAAAQASVAAQKDAEALADAQKKVSDTAAQLTAAQNQSSTAMAQIDARTKGAADAVGNTFTGRIKAAETEIGNFISVNGAKFGKWMVEIGPIMMTVGMIIESNLIPRLVLFGVHLLGTGIMAAETAASMIASAIATAAAWVAANIAIIAATGGIILVLGLLIVGAYELVTHWSTVWKAIKDIIGDAVAWVKDHLFLVMALVAPFLIPFYELWKHWGEIWGGITDIFGAFLRFWARAWDWIQQVVADVWNFLKPIFDAIGGAISAVGGAISAVGHAGGAIAHVLGFQSGGVVPGATGSPQFAIVHGGETIIPPASSLVIAPPLAGAGGLGGVVNLNVYVSGLGILTPDGLAQTLFDPLRSVAQRTLGRSAGSTGLA